MPRISATKKTAAHPAADQPEPVESTSVATVEPPKSPPKKKAAAPEPMSDLLAEEVGRERRLAVAREELVFCRHKLLADGFDLSVDELRLLKTAVPKSPTLGDYDYKERFGKYLHREAKRVGTIINLQAAAGRPADQTTADTLATETADDRDKQAPGIEEEILKLEDALQTLRQTAADAQSAADARREADKNLRDPKLLPGFIRDELDAAHRNHMHDFGKEILQLEGRRSSLVSLIGLDTESTEGLEIVKGHVGDLPRFGGDVISRLKNVFTFTAEQRPGGVAHRFEKLRPEVWEDYCADLRHELADVESRIAEIAGGQQADADREVDALRSFYVLK